MQFLPSLSTKFSEMISNDRNHISTKVSMMIKSVVNVCIGIIRFISNILLETSSQTKEIQSMLQYSIQQYRDDVPLKELILYLWHRGNLHVFYK